jgi:acetyl esterase/lipase
MTIIPASGIADGQIIRIWPEVPPGSAGLTFTEEVIERSPEPDAIKDRAVVKVIDPTLTVYRPDRPNGAGLLIAPGGGYQRVVIDKEGEELAPWLGTLGITAFVLRYRLPGDGHRSGPDTPLQDAQRAIRLIRANAKAWSLDPQRIGVLGFSAGGHVASGLAVKYGQPVYPPLDAVDEANARPDFLILGYPVISMRQEITHPGSRWWLLGAEPDPERVDAYSNELLITEDTPATFLMHAGDDASVPVENSIRFYLGLRKAGVPAELHIFKEGGHGYSIRFAKGKTAENWTLLCGQWLKSIGVVR